MNVTTKGVAQSLQLYWQSKQKPRELGSASGFVVLMNMLQPSPSQGLPAHSESCCYY